MIALLQKRGVPIVLVARAEQNEHGEGFSNQNVERLNQIVEQFKDEDVYYMNTPEVFFSHHPSLSDKKMLFHDKTHWTPRGHHLVALEISKLVARIAPTGN